MPVLDLKLYTTISVCVALVAFLYSCDIFTLPFTTSFQKWFLFTSSLTPVDNSQNEACIDVSTEHRSSNNIDESWDVPEKSPHVATSVFQNMLAERYLTPRKPVGSMGPFLTSLFNFLQKEKTCVM
ncbi:3624_t:CDS:1, partial [Racocetra persica]